MLRSKSGYVEKNATAVECSCLLYLLGYWGMHNNDTFDGRFHDNRDIDATLAQNFYAD